MIGAILREAIAIGARDRALPADALRRTAGEISAGDLATVAALAVAP